MPALPGPHQQMVTQEESATLSEGEGVDIVAIVRQPTPSAPRALPLHARFRVWTGPFVSATLLPLGVF